MSRWRVNPAASPRRSPLAVARRALVVLLDGGGLVAFAWLIWAILLSRTIWHDSSALWVVGAGVLGALLAQQRSMRTPLDIPIAVYVILSVISAAATYNTYPMVLPGNDGYVERWWPAFDTVVLAAYFYAVLYVLRTPRRVAMFIVLFVVVVSWFGLTASVFHARYGFDNGRPEEYRGMGLWTGYNELGLLFLLALAFLFSVALAARSIVARMAAATAAGVLFLQLILLESKGAFLSLAAMVSLFLIVQVRRRSYVQIVAIAGGLVLLVLVFGTLASKTLQGMLWELGSGDSTSRMGIWARTAHIVADHPLLGVGPGHYQPAVRSYIRESKEFFAHAHNTFVHVAAERGIVAAVAFFVIWWRLLRGLWSASSSSTAAGLIALGMLGALGVFFTRMQSDHFFTGLFISNKMEFLLWTLFAAAASTIRSSGIWPAPVPRVNDRPTAAAAGSTI